MNICVNEDLAWHALVRLQGETAAELAALLPALLDRGWTPSLPARSGFAISLREMDLLVPTRGPAGFRP